MDQTSVDDEVGVGAPLRPDVSKVNVSITLVGGLLLGSPLGIELFLFFFFEIGQYLSALFVEAKPLSQWLSSFLFPAGPFLEHHRLQSKLWGQTGLFCPLVTAFAL